jgi:hypothetical protein
MKHRHDMGSGGVRSGGGYQPPPPRFTDKLSDQFNRFKGGIALVALAAVTGGGAYAWRSAKNGEDVVPDDVKRDIALMEAGVKPPMRCFSQEGKPLWRGTPTDEMIENGEACVPKTIDEIVGGHCFVTPGQLASNTEDKRAHSAAAAADLLQQIVRSDEARQILKTVVESPAAASLLSMDPNELRDIAKEAADPAKTGAVIDRLKGQADQAALIGQLQATPGSRRALHLITTYIGLLNPEEVSYCFVKKAGPPAKPAPSSSSGTGPVITY